MAFTSVTLNPGSGGDVIATQTYNGLEYQCIVPTWGADGGAFNLTDLPTGLPVQLVAGTKNTYRAAATGVVPVASATDVFEISGSATTTVKINKIIFTGTATTAAIGSVKLIKRSTANSSGTSSTLTNVPLKTGITASTAVVKSYTANPTTGSAVGTIDSRQYCFVDSDTSPVEVKELVFDFTNGGGGPVILTAAAQMLCVNLNTTSYTGGALDMVVEWTEE